MTNFKARLLALCALMVLLAAALAPKAAEAQAYGPGCRDIIVNCGPYYNPHNCVGKRVDMTCQYLASCLTCP